MVKKLIFISMCFVCFSELIAQECTTKSKDSIEIIFAVDAWPEFNNEGLDGLSKFIRDNIQEVVVPDGSSKVIVQFHVDTLGYTSNYKIIKSVNSALDNEAIRISRLLKFMHPAIQSGKPVNFTYTLGFDFEKLNLDNKASKKNKNRSEQK